MRAIQAFTDKFAITLSFLCVIHCVVLPFLLVLLPSLGVWQLDNEAFHSWLLIAVLPVSLYALVSGYKKHQQYRFLLIGISGLLLLLFAAVFGHDTVGEAGEKVLTVLGATLVAIAHWVNFTRCKHASNCINGINAQCD
ncbi:MerC domain-containing protein [Shewanella litoralis]|uniref:MerC domain-containing protein n=1 Tax=Shewanella litoralis TaxID=2282700 RepID=A0ABQ2R2M9_9GAMM|nr:MerC domain-containing protein [Shewanella litoralis]GGQ04849.1 hypothetical protein GCM10009411_02560 [Shewanella litoralis]